MVLIKEAEEVTNSAIIIITPAVEVVVGVTKVIMTVIQVISKKKIKFGADLAMKKENIFKNYI